MKAIQLMLDERLLADLDREAHRQRTDRSKLIRTAAARYLAESRTCALEAAYRRGYEKHPQTTDEVNPWLALQAWPED